MPRKRYQKSSKDEKALQSEFVSYDTTLPIDEPIAIYYRQSTEAQIGNISTTMQTVDMVRYLQARGWDEDNVWMIDMDAGVSGTKKIDERQGMSHLFELITTGQIKAVACQDEDRLFRDITQIQVNIFIEACKENRVLVLTPSVVYDFAHPLMGSHHARQFRFKSEMAAEYIESYVRGRLLKSKASLQSSGRWAGPPMPTGYMADMRKQVAGVPNENWRKYAVFEPYAEVIREYFQLFLLCGRNLRQTAIHIEQHGPYLPNPHECEPPEGFKIVYRIKPTNGRWYPSSRAALKSLLTNAIYLGHWMYEGQVVIWDNHPPLIDESVFMQAFNTLSRITFTGEPNLDYNPRHIQARPTKDQQRPKERPLCLGVMVSREHEAGEWLPVGSSWVAPLQHYTYSFLSRNSFSDYVWSKSSEPVDQRIGQLLFDKLSATFDFDAWEQSVSVLIEEQGRQHKIQEAQLEQLETVMQNIVNSLTTLTHPALIRAAERQYEDAEAEYARLQTQLASAETQRASVEYIMKLRESSNQALARWPKLSVDEKREILQTFVDRIEALPTPNHGLHLTIIWKDTSQNELRIARQTNTGNGWLAEEVDALLSMVAQGALQIEIAQEFPERTWQMISNRYRLSTDKQLVMKPKPIRGHERYQDYLDRLAQQGITDPSGDDYFDSRIYWQEEELILLIDLVKRGEPQTTIAQNFPERPWRAIRDKYKSYSGERLVVNPKPIQDHERYEDYVEHMTYDSTQDNASSQQRIAGAPWHADEIELLVKLVIGDGTQVEIAQAFPHRTWKSIREKYLRETGKTLIPDPKPILSRETYTDYLARVESESSDVSSDVSMNKAAVWQPEEVDLLLSMVEQGESQLAIAQTFPHRRWSKIVAKYRKVTGTRLPIECSHLRSYERYEDYLDRIHETQVIPDRDEWLQIPNAPWQSYEVDLLLKMVEQGEAQTAIAQTFPHRNWKAISGKYFQVTGETLVVEPKPIREHERFADHERRTDSKMSTTNMGSEVHSSMNCPSLVRAIWKRYASPSRTASSPSAAPVDRSPSRPTLCWWPRSTPAPVATMATIATSALAP